jgi:hypothetical protein
MLIFLALDLDAHHYCLKIDKIDPFKIKLFTFWGFGVLGLIPLP